MEPTERPESKPSKLPYSELVRALSENKALFTEVELQAIKTNAKRDAGFRGEKIKSESTWEAIHALHILEKKYEIDALPFVFVEPMKEGRRDQRGALLLVAPRAEEEFYIAYGEHNNPPINYKVAEQATSIMRFASPNSLKYKALQQEYNEIRVIRTA